MAGRKLLLGKFRKFIESLSKKDVVAVMHHTDPDGVCAAVIMAKLVEKVRGKKIDLRINQPASDIAVLKETILRLRQEKVNRLITVDLGIDQSPASVREIEGFAEILVIDHHKIYNDLNSARTLMIKPQLVSEKNPAAYPASKLCFDLASGIADMSSLDWVAAIGLVGDCAFSSWKDFLDSVLSKYKIEKKADIFDTGIGKAASLISDAESFDNSKVSESYEVVYRASGIGGVLSSSLQKYREAVENEISYWESHLDGFAEFRDEIGLIFYFINSKFRIKAPLNTRLSIKYPDKTIILLSELDDGMIGMSARRRDEKYAMNDLLEKSVIGLDGASAGGHIPAAGGKIRKEDLQKFKENLVGVLKKWTSSG